MHNIKNLTRQASKREEQMERKEKEDKLGS